MSDQALKHNLIERILEELINTHNIYNQNHEAITRCAHIDEYIFRDNIISRLNSIGFQKIEREYSVESILREMNINKGNGIIRNGNIDILIRGRDEKPRIMVELKREFTKKKPTEVDDIIRIRDILLLDQKNSTLEFGIFAFTLCRDIPGSKGGKTPGAYLEENFQGFEKNIKKKVDPKGCTISFSQSLIAKNDEVAWGAICVIIDPPQL